MFTFHFLDMTRDAHREKNTSGRQTRLQHKEESQGAKTSFQHVRMLKLTARPKSFLWDVCHRRVDACGVVIQ